MRHKQQPVKHSRHKSVTSIIDSPQTSFGHYHDASSVHQPSSAESPLLRKQFEHNVRHMSDVMRLAFLENNDICPETLDDVDFNTLSTAGILQRNIQQQLQQQRRDQQRQQQQQLQQQQQQLQQQQQQLQHQQQMLLLRLQQQQQPSPPLSQEEDDEFILDEPMPFADFESHIELDTVGRGSNISNAEGFFCDEPGCGKSFPSLRKLRHHKVVHSNEFPFVCQFEGCAKKFKRKFGIDLHSTTHFDLDPEMYSKTSNNSSLPFFGRRMQYSMCKPCGQKFKTVHEYQYHMLKHGKEPFKCPVKGCGQTFGIWKSFQKHRASHYFNYYCKMDPRCDHHTSNLQLLKLHIYCCHFRRKLPKNATLTSKDRTEEESTKDEPADAELQPSRSSSQFEDNFQDDIQSVSVDEAPQQSNLSTPRRDSRLRKNPPRSSAFGHQDYASVNNGVSLAKSISSMPQSKRTRSTAKQQQQHHIQQQQQQLSQTSSQDDEFIGGEDVHAAELSTQIKTETVGRASNVSTAEGFLCDEPGCGKSFPSLRKLRHHKVVHSNEFPFVCQFEGCAKKFKRKFGIDLHSTTHFDLDPEMYSKTSNNSSLPFFGRRMQYSMCKPCGQKFKTVHEYQYHMLKHGKEPFKCPVKGCGQTFGIWKSFQKHRASHYFNYYCKMDPRCDHHTSNLQLLKLHIYCCHFRRKLPKNATLTSKDRTEEDRTEEDNADEDRTEEESTREDPTDLELQPSQSSSQLEDNFQDDTQSMSIDETPQQSTRSTPRRDSRLRKNPPRSSTFGHQDYASINNGISLSRSFGSTSQSKRTRSSAKQHQTQRQQRPSQPLSQDEFIQDELESHVKSETTGRGSGVTNAGGFFCDEPGCGESFTSLRKLRNHKIVHSDEFPFLCKFDGTGKKFKRKSGIELHATTHYDIDPEMYNKTSSSSLHS